MPSALLDDFTAAEIDTGDAVIFARSGGRGPAVLLLHGFPENHLMWHRIAPILAQHFTVVLADLPGYGRSKASSSAQNTSRYSKRAFARDMIAVMEHLGFARFSIAGHDRGGRVAYRLALDHPERVERLAVLDIVPTETAWARADARFATAFWPWSLLAQDEPLPERILTATADAIVQGALEGWGSAGAAFPPEIRAAYVEALRDPAQAHAICQEYRAAATVDREHDREALASGRRITAPLLVLWSAHGPLHTWYAADGGPLEIWRTWAANVCGHAVQAGHFFPEELPQPTAEELAQFFGREVESL
ncbi:alpha/beta hydrolase [Opitutaceae bacterium EW11]|nr:alpha/beta hydrolase [Opitutaceae bacterium EW11]